MLYKNLMASMTGSIPEHMPTLPGSTVCQERSLLHSKGGRLTKTALHQAVIDERYRQARLLLANGSDVNAKDANGWTPLMLTCIVQRDMTRMALMKIFLKNGAKLNTQENMGRTCLMIACMTGRTEMVSILLSEEDIQLLTQDKDGNTALMHAAKCSENIPLSLTLDKMISFGLDIDIRNHLGYTALLLACKSGNYQHALQLVRKGQACPHLRDYEFQLSAKDWLLRHESEKRRRVLRSQQFPHLIKVRSLTEYSGITEHKMLNNIIDRIYTPSSTTWADHSLNRARTQLPLTVPKKEISITQDVNEKLLRELLRLITRVEEVTDASHNKHSRLRGRTRESTNRKREISTAVLRSLTPCNRYSQQATIHTLFQLYARNYQHKLRARPAVAAR